MVSRCTKVVTSFDAFVVLVVLDLSAVVYTIRMST